jgi:hypothetical protein
MCARDHQFEGDAQLDPAIVEVRWFTHFLEVFVACCAFQAIEWQAERTPAEVMQQREEMMSKLEEANAAMWESGKRAEWFQRCDGITKGVSAGVNGYLLQELLCASGHCDPAAADLFRNGKCLHACFTYGCNAMVVSQVPTCWVNWHAVEWANHRRSTASKALTV